MLLSLTTAFTSAYASGSESEHIAVLEAAAALEHELGGGGTQLGPALGVEVEPIENWLEIELGAARFRSVGSTLWDLDLALKKPLRLSDSVELMPGIGPTWEQTSGAGQHGGPWGAEAVLDLFIWQSRRFGWFLEPAYGFTPGSGANRSLMVTAGLFLAIP